MKRRVLGVEDESQFTKSKERPSSRGRWCHWQSMNMYA